MIFNYKSTSDAKTLGGHGAEYFASVEDMKNGLLCYPLTNGFDLNNAFGRYATANGSVVSSLLNKPSEVSVGEVFVEWLPTSGANYGIQNLYHSVYDSSVGGYHTTKYTRSFSYAWGKWEKTATTADLAKYLPLTGGEIKGNVDLVSSSAQGRQLTLKNSNRQIRLAITSDGLFTAWDATNSKDVLYSTADGTNTFNGTASGNLPLTGGTLTMNGHHTPLILKSANPNDPTCLLEFRENNNYLGHLGFTRTKGAMVRATDSSYYSIHHDGNSSKVVISQTAPSDTAALWVY